MKAYLAEHLEDHADRSTQRNDRLLEAANQLEQVLMDGRPRHLLLVESIAALLNLDEEQIRGVEPSSCRQQEASTCLIVDESAGVD